MFFILESNEKPPPNKPIETIDAVRQILVGLLQDQHEQQRYVMNQTTTIRASRLNNTTGVNITEDEFLKIMQEKSSVKKKRSTSRKTTKDAQKPRRSITKKKKPDNNDAGGDQENDVIMEFESSTGANPDLGVTETRILFDDKDLTSF